MRKSRTEKVRHFLKLLLNFVYLPITPRIVVQSCCDKSDLGFVGAPIFRWASASIRNADLSRYPPASLFKRMDI